MNNENDKNVQNISRVVTLTPWISEDKFWKEKVYKFTIINNTEKVEYYKNVKKKEKDDEKKQKIEEKIKRCQSLIEIAENKGEINKEMAVDYTYSLIREAMESEARRKNYILSYIYSELVSMGASYMEYKDVCKKINELLKPAYRKKGSKKGSIYDNTEIDNILEGYGFAFNQGFTRKIKDCVKNGLLIGKVSLPTYKLDSPFSISKQSMCFSHNYDSFEELCEYIYKNDSDIYFNYGSNEKPTIAKFKVNFGHNKNKRELQSTLLKIFSGEYSFGGSSIEIGKNNKILLHLSLEIPNKEVELDENTVVGVDLGIAVPAVCVLNNSDYAKEFIGSKDDFLRVRTQLQSQRKRMQKALSLSNGGHGRKKKLQALDRLKSKESNFVQTYNHNVSKRIVDFALRNKAKYINLECLKGYDTSDYILRNWSYYQLQSYIEYKASKYGIIVRYINPCYTSQVCSYCGHWEEGQRKSQSEFECANEDCKSHEIKGGLNADLNAARNIAKSTLFLDNKSVKKINDKHKEEARKYYGIK